MATITHIIRSHYDPADRDKLERETGQQINDQSDPWQTESSFSSQRRICAAPTFVPATVVYDEWGVPLHTASPTAASKLPDLPSISIAEWYRSLTASSSRAPPAAPPRFSNALTHRRGSQGSRPAQKPHRESITMNNWFISKVLSSTKPSTPTPSLADMLARDPPPLPSEGRYNPPVWLHIGPSNRGFGMLQRSGWKEGEGLGAHVPDARTRETSPSVKTTGDAKEVIDLSQSDSDASGDALEDVIQQTQVAGDASAPQRSLLTPLPTILKADRLGIGLKAKTEGPHKHSKKRVTHGAAALAAHARSAEEVRRKKAAFGKGRRGFARAHKKEEDKRKTTLAYLNE